MDISCTGLIDYAHDVVFFIAGFVAILYGYAQLRKKRLIENIPSSKIRSVAMGLSEVNGIAKERGKLISPITGTECVYYKFRVEREDRDSKGRTHWKTVRSGESTNYFYVTDDTGELLVDPLGAEVVINQDYRIVDSIWQTLGRKRFRYTEWYIKPGETFFIIGTVREFKDYGDDRKEKIAERLRGLKNNKQQLMLYDKNGDGNISIEEWDAAKVDVEQKVLEEELSQALPEVKDDIVIAKGNSGDTVFAFSDRGEKAIIQHLSLSGYGLNTLGIVVSIVMVISFLNRAGIILTGHAIPWVEIYKAMSK
ncbi:MAG: GIDE domain-containing protein [Elusimicrobiota bacterium]